MSRIVNLNSPGKRRNQNMRASAELLRHLSQKTEIDEEARDMIAALYLALQDIDDGLDEAVDAWEKRDYWVKAEQFRQKWAWVGAYAAKLRVILQNQDWATMPALMVQLFPYFAEIKITKLTRKADLWQGKYNQVAKTIQPST